MGDLVTELVRAWTRNARRWEKLAPEIRAAGVDVWNPGLYAGSLHAAFLERFPPRKHALLVLGLNPGPAGMALTGIPFTDVRTAKAVLGFANLGETGAAPADLVTRLRKPNGKLRLSYERSSLGIYAALRACWGDLKTAYANWFVGNPCPLLFLDGKPGGWNVTPADPRLARIAEMRTLREQAVAEFAQILAPRAVLFLGKDVETATHGVALRLMQGDERRLVPWPHPARAVPKQWAATLKRELNRRGLLHARASRDGSREAALPTD